MKWEFVSADSADAADRLIAEILSRIRRLASFPNQGHRRPNLTARPMRFVRAHNYLIAYAVHKNRFASFAVIHGRRDPRVTAAILRSRE
jgi:plasmid stabilization system protein ParE